MDGHDLIAEAQRPGVMALFVVVLRPVIGIIAFCGSFLVVTMALDTLNTLWGLGFAGNTGSHVVDPFGILPDGRSRLTWRTRSACAASI